MNKKNLLHLMAIMMVAMLSVGFASCSSDDDEEDNGYSTSILGSWQTEDENFSTELSFNANGTCTELMEMKGMSIAAKMRYSGTYNVKGDKLTINWKGYEGWNPLTNRWLDMTDDPETVVITISISGNKLTFLSMEGEKTNSPTIYTKK
mgnify:CR=1 FL=1